MITKKIMTAVALISASTMLADAAYTWVGTTSSDWATKSNWELSGSSTWTDNSSGPGTSSSNMWDEIIFDKTRYTTAPTVPATFEGWNFKVSLKNGAQITLGNFNKFQTGSSGASKIEVDASSKLTISATSNFAFRPEGTTTFDIQSYEGLTMTQCVFSYSDSNPPSNPFSINLHTLGSVKSVWSLSGNIQISFTAELSYDTTNSGQYTIKETSGDYRLVARVLWSNQADNGGVLSDTQNFTISGETTPLTKSDTALTATADSIGKYYLVKEDNSQSASGTSGKNIVVYYVEQIPEPSAFGLLAGLGAIALAVSRRRKH